MNTKEEQRDPSEIVLHAEIIKGIIESKWGMLILRELHYRNRAMRFNELLHELKPIDSRSLSLQLKNLLKGDMIKKNKILTIKFNIHPWFTVLKVLLRDTAEPTMTRRNPAPDRLPAARVARGGKSKTTSEPAS